MAEGDAKSTTAVGRCPVCRAAAVHKHRPFCSRRCADIDLSRWLKGTYVIAGGTADEDDATSIREAEDEPPQRSDGGRR